MNLTSQSGARALVGILILLIVIAAGWWWYYEAHKAQSLTASVSPTADASSSGSGSYIINFMPAKNIVYLSENYSVTVSPCFTSDIYNPVYGIAEWTSTSTTELVPGVNLTGDYAYSLIDGLGNSDFRCDATADTETFNLSIDSMSSASEMDRPSLTPGTFVLFVANESPGNSNIPDTDQILAVSNPFQLTGAVK
jgi:hypothetical protein